MWSITVNLALIFALAIVSCESFFLHSDYSYLEIRCADGYEHVYPSVCNLDCGNSKAFHCKSKESHQCIYRENQCDGIKDCPNGRDESNCPECSLKSDLFSCKDNSSCLPLSRVCDGVQDCKDGSDEGYGCTTPTSPSRSCAAGREIQLPTGPRCHCGKGFMAIKPSSSLDYESCEDIDECKVHGTCSQRCTNLPGSYECSCWTGHKLLADNRTCVVRMHSLVYFSNSNSIGYYDLLKEETFTVVENQNTGRVSADDNYLYWTHSSHFYRMKLTDPSTKESFPLAGIGRAKGFAVDWWTGNIYLISDTISERIVVCADMGMKCLLLLTRDSGYSYYNKYSNQEIVLHPKIGKMFWVSYFGSINSAFMDGKNEKSIVMAERGDISALTIDQTGDRLFWMNKSTLETANLDGSDRHTIASFPDYLDGTVLEDRIYWIGKRGLNSADERTGKNEQNLMTNNKFTSVYGYHPLIHYKVKSAKNPCHAEPCSYICLLGENGTHTCGSKFGPCPRGSWDCALDELYNRNHMNGITFKRVDIAQKEVRINQVLAYVYCILIGLLLTATYLFFKWKLWSKQSILNLIRPGTAAIEPTTTEPSVAFTSVKEVD